MVEVLGDDKISHGMRTCTTVTAMRAALKMGAQRVTPNSIVQPVHSDAAKPKIDVREPMRTKDDPSSAATTAGVVVVMSDDSNPTTTRTTLDDQSSGILVYVAICWWTYQHRGPKKNVAGRRRVRKKTTALVLVASTHIVAVTVPTKKALAPASAMFLVESLLLLLSPSLGDTVREQAANVDVKRLDRPVKATQGARIAILNKTNAPVTGLSQYKTWEQLHRVVLSTAK
mmetsp:Transcript_5335/g.7689  ORF Transcript_5335/g.7689 Transcript_5335/m.7689 type:complete len:229 (-) Transcript_5335:817-1503(-)